MIEYNYSNNHQNYFRDFFTVLCKLLDKNENSKLINYFRGSSKIKTKGRLMDTEITYPSGKKIITGWPCLPFANWYEMIEEVPIHKPLNIIKSPTILKDILDLQPDKNIKIFTGSKDIINILMYLPHMYQLPSVATYPSPQRKKLPAAEIHKFLKEI